MKCVHQYNFLVLNKYYFLKNTVPTKSNSAALFEILTKAS